MSFRNSRPDKSHLLTNKNNNNFLKVGSINIHSIRNKIISIVEFLNEHNLDLLFICETWLHGSETEVIQAALPSHYKIEHAPRSEDTMDRGGGVAIIYKTVFSLVKILPTFNTKTSFEALSYSFYVNNVCLNAAVIYRPGHPGTDVTFLDEFNEFISAFSELGNHYCICGDFNYWMDDVHGKPYSFKFLNLLEANNCLNSINTPTHLAGHTLDLVIHDRENNSIKDIVVYPIDYKLTDHSLLTFTYKFPKKDPAICKNIKFRKYKERNVDKLHSDLTNAFSFINLNLEPTALVKAFNSTLSALHDNHFPIVEKSIRVKDSNPWFDSSIARLRNERRKAERHWRKCGSELSRKKYIEARGRVVDQVQLKKENYFNSQINDCKADQKKLWNIFDKLTGILEPQDPSTATTDDINSYFINKIENIRLELDDLTYSENYSNSFLNYNNDNVRTSNLNIFKPLTEAEVLHIVKSVNKTYCLLDPFNFSRVTEIVPLLIPIFTKIINSCFSFGIFPDSEKSAIVRPLLKKLSLDNNELKNFRPVSNLTYLSKLIEKAIQYQLVPHLIKNKCISEFQSAYRPHHSTETALCRIYNDLLANIQDSKASLLILLDLSAAFDTIDHNLLINDLRDAGITGNALLLLQSYLTNRYQKVFTNKSNSTSLPLQLKYGVPQGSVLGPILFSLYSSKLAKIMQAHGVEYHIYADDTQIYMPVTDLTLCKNKLDTILTDIKLWMHERKLKLNEGKTEIILINGLLKNNFVNDVNNIVLIKNVQPVESVRDLGLILDSQLSLRSHFNTVIKSCNYHLRRLSSIIKYLDKDSASTLMHAFITSRLDYCNSLFVNLPKKDLVRLQYILNRAARMIFKLPPFLSISSYLYELHWLPVKARIEFKVCLLVYKALKFKEPSYIFNLLNYYSPNSDMLLRAADDPHLLIVPRLNKQSTFGSRAISYAGSKLFNSLPRSIKDAGSTDIFKKQLKTHLFKKAYDCETKTIRVEYGT